MVKIKLQDVKKTYEWGDETIEVIKGISLEIMAGHFVSIVGESGSGKTTLLNLLGGLDFPNSGLIQVDDKQISSFSTDEFAEFRNKKLGFIFQFYNLLQDFTILENVMLPHYILTQNKKESLKKSKELLSQLGLSNRLDYYPSKLSGGEQQRAAIARALINQPEIVLADEPTGNLDKENREKVIQLLTDVKNDYQFTLVMVTHDMNIAERADQCIRLNYGIIDKIEKRI